MVGLQAMSVNELGTHQPRFPSKHAMMGQNSAPIDRPDSTEACLRMLITGFKTRRRSGDFMDDI